MIGWIGDFFRFWWASYYWNFRKTWFRLRGGQRDDCPCQNYGDSGHALDARCEAVVQWHQPARFRRVCPLLTETKDGWRCGVDAERVRPFWGRAALHTGAMLLVLYLGGATAVFGVLRLAHYQASFLAVLWPGRWAELRTAQERVYAARARAALDRGNFQEAMLSLDMVCQINPRNYEAGLALAGLGLAAAQPYVADQIYERLLRDVPERRIATAQIWFRTLLSRAAYPRIKALAAVMIHEDAAGRSAWLNGLLFAARQTRDSQSLAAIGSTARDLPPWCTEAIDLERLMLEGKSDEALPRLTRMEGRSVGPYLPYFQTDRLLRIGRADQANSLLNAYGDALPVDEASFLRLRIYRAKGWDSLLEAEYENLLQYPPTPRLAAEFCAFLIAHPDAGLAARFCDRYVGAGLPLTSDTIPHYQASFLATTLAGDKARSSAILAAISRFTASDAKVLRGLADLLVAGQPDVRFTRMLPLVPLPTEAVYAVLERQPGVPSP